MKGNNAIISFIQNLKRAKLQGEDFIRDWPDSLGSTMLKKYLAKIDWIFLDLKTTTVFPPIVVEVYEERLTGSMCLMWMKYKKKPL